MQIQSKLDMEIPELVNILTDTIEVMLWVFYNLFVVTKLNIVVTMCV